MLLVAPLGASSCGKRNTESAPTERIASALAVGSAVTQFQPNIKWQGRIQALEIDPTDPNFVVAGTDHGGLYTSADGGLTWTRADNLEQGAARPMAISDVAICPTNSKIILVTAYAGSGTAPASDPGGIWRTDNKGMTWARIASGAGNVRLSAYGAAFEPGSNCETAYVGTDFGVSRCTNLAQNCTNFTVPTTGANDGALAVAVQAGGMVDIHTFNGHRRRNFGVGAPTFGVWSALNNPIGPCPGGTCPAGGLPPSAGGGATHSLAISPFNGGQVLFGAAGVIKQQDDNNDGVVDQVVFDDGYEVYESDDGGGTWKTLKIPRDHGFNRIPYVFAVPTRDTSKPAQSFDVYVGDGVDVYRQTCREQGGLSLRCTSGAGWERINLRSPGGNPAGTDCGDNDLAPCTHNDPSDMAFSANNCPLFIASDGGVLKVSASATAPTCGQTGEWFTTGSATLKALEIYDIAGQVHPGSMLGTDLVFSTQDNDFWASQNGGASWPRNIEFEGGGIDVVHSAPDRSSTLFTAFDCFGCFNFEAVSGFDPDPTKRAVAWTDGGNKKDRITRSCPDEDKDGVCDTCIDNFKNDGTMGKDMLCDVGVKSRIPCRDASGQQLAVANPMPQCVGQPCIDKVNNAGPDGAYGICDPIAGLDFNAHAPIVLSAGTYLQWDGGSLKAASPSAADPQVLTTNQLFLTTDNGANWTALPTVSLGTPGTVKSMTETTTGMGAVGRDAGGQPVFYQGTVKPGFGNGLIRVDSILSTAALKRADVGLPAMDSRGFNFSGAFNVDPGNSEHLIAATNSGFRQSVNGGQTWTNDPGMQQLTKLVRANGLLNLAGQTSSIEFDVVNGGQRILVGTDQGGIVASLNGGQTWARLCLSDRVPLVTHFFFDEVQTKVYATSFGRGLWTVDTSKRQLPEFTTEPANASHNNCGPVDVVRPVAVDQCETPPSPVTLAVTASGSASAAGCTTGSGPCGNFPAGTTTLTWTATDAYGDVTTATSTVTVTDTTKPTIKAPSKRTISVCTNVDIGQPTMVADDCGGMPMISDDRPAKFPIGDTVVTWTATDAAGNKGTDTQIVTVVLGDDTSCCPTGSHIIVGTANGDRLDGTSGSDCILGRGGQDFIVGNGGNDFISGGADADFVTGGDGNDVIFGGPGADNLNGDNGNDTISGQEDGDSIAGGAGTDTCSGGPGTNAISTCEVIK